MSVEVSCCCCTGYRGVGHWSGSSRFRATGIVTVLTILILANLVCAPVRNESGTGVIVALPSVLATGISLAALIVGVDRECESSDGINGQKEKAVDEGVAHKVLKYMFGVMSSSIEILACCKSCDWLVSRRLEVKNTWRG